MLSVSRPFVIRKNKVCAKMYQHFFFFALQKNCPIYYTEKEKPSVYQTHLHLAALDLFCGWAFALDQLQLD